MQAQKSLPSLQMRAWGGVSCFANTLALLQTRSISLLIVRGYDSVSWIKEFEFSADLSYINFVFLCHVYSY